MDGRERGVCRSPLLTPLPATTTTPSSSSRAAAAAAESAAAGGLSAVRAQLASLDAAMQAESLKAKKAAAALRRRTE